MRCFIAIEVAEKVKTALAELQKELKGCNADIRWIKPENIHLTLKFLSNVDEKMLGKIKSKLKNTCNKYNGFTLEVKSMGLFPDKRRPRVLWVDIRDNNSLTGLQRDIDEEMASIGFGKEDRRFSPHLTIGRFKSSTGIEALYDKILLHKDDNFGLVDVRFVSLMESRLNPSGAEYSRIAEVSLKI